MLKHPTASRTRVLVVTAALAAAGLPLLVGGPAQAASVPLTYHCTDSPNVGEYDFSAVVDTNAPATLGCGHDHADHGDVRRDDPGGPRRPAWLGSVADRRGHQPATGTVDGAGRVSTLAIPKTAVPA